ncbi:hypothetical protein ACWE42_15675 [Sutcliffiella cohnii]
MLPAIDVGLMNEHLSTHAGLLGKLDIFLAATDNKYIRKFILTQQRVLNDHVNIMLALLNPTKTEWVSLPTINLQEKLEVFNETTSTKKTKQIALELQSMTKTMAQTNFNSALMMKDENVKYVHFEMAQQQATMKVFLDKFIKNMGWSESANVPSSVQQKVIEHFEHLRH